MISIFLLTYLDLYCWALSQINEQHCVIICVQPFVDSFQIPNILFILSEAVTEIE